MQVTVENPGTLGIVVGADWSVLNHAPADLDPPYLVSVEEDQDSEPVVFYVAGDHYSETLRRNTIPHEAARAAMRHFVATGRLSPDVTWGRRAVSRTATGCESRDPASLDARR